MSEFTCPVCNNTLRTNREIVPDMVCLSCWQDYPEKVKSYESLKQKDSEIATLKLALKDYNKVYGMMWQYFQCSEQCTSNHSWAKKCSCGADKKSLEVREILSKHKELLESINNQLNNTK